MSAGHEDLCDACRAALVCNKNTVISSTLRI